MQNFHGGFVFLVNAVLILRAHEFVQDFMETARLYRIEKILELGLLFRHGQCSRLSSIIRDSRYEAQGEEGDQEEGEEEVLYLKHIVLNLCLCRSIVVISGK
jgi:hypothetical protein